MASEGAPSLDPLDEVRFDVRSVGYCVLCDAIVERTGDGGCLAGHEARAVSGQMVLDPRDPLPVLPRFSLGAFLMPPIWGPAHGQWAGAFFLPIWLFADSAIVAAARGGGLQWIGAAVVIAGTLGFEYFFARKANGVAYRRVMGTMSVAEFTRRERIWGYAMIPLAAALIGWGLYFDLVLSATLAR